MAKAKDRDTYTLTVVFSRSFSDDSNVLGNKRRTDSALLQQFRKELQMAYDDPDIAMAGRFNITRINTKACRAKRPARD